jgi:phage terminase large subunit-like protein
LQFRSYEDHPQTGAGDQLHLVWLDEVPKEAHYREAVARVTRFGGRVLITCTPVDRPVGWFRDIIEPPLEGDKRAVWIAGKGRPDGAQWKQYVIPFSRENVPWLDEDSYQQQVDLVSADPTQARQRLEGAWEGLTRSRLFTAYGSRCQVHRPQLDGWRYALGIDHGEMAGNQIGLLCAYRGSSLHVLAEYRDAASVDYQEDARGMLDLMAKHSISPLDIAVAVGDTNKTKGGRRVNEVIETSIRVQLGMSRPPFRIEGANKRAGSVDFARRIINYGLQRGDLTIEPRCTYLASCLAGYRGIDTGDDKALSHGVAALRYIASRILAETPTYRELRFR